MLRSQEDSTTLILDDTDRMGISVMLTWLTTWQVRATSPQSSTGLVITCLSDIQTFISSTKAVVLCTYCHTASLTALVDKCQHVMALHSQYRYLQMCCEPASTLTTRHLRSARLTVPRTRTNYSEHSLDVVSVLMEAYVVPSSHVSDWLQLYTDHIVTVLVVKTRNFMTVSM